MVQEARLQKATDELNEAQEQLDEKQRELDVVQAKYDQAMRDKQTLVDDAEACRRKMANATALIDGLGGEKTRWTEQSKKFEQQIQRCVRNGFKMPLCCRLWIVVELAEFRIQNSASLRSERFRGVFVRFSTLLSPPPSSVSFALVPISARSKSEKHTKLQHKKPQQPWWVLSVV